MECILVLSNVNIIWINMI